MDNTESQSTIERIKQQIEEISQAQVYLTNNGGGSASSLFLPPGSTVVLFHQVQGPKRDVDWYANQGYLDYTFLQAQVPTVQVTDVIESAFSKRH